MKRPLPPHTASSSTLPLPVASQCPVAQAAQDDDSQPQNYFVGEDGHRVYGDRVFRVT
ncbi:MAG: hypothetical protein ACRDRI_05970 [Pseudonocardiaceae bacterium]